MLEQQVKSLQRTALILYGALFMSLLVYVFIAFNVLGSMEGGAPEDIATIKLALTAAAIAVGGASVLLPRVLLSESRVRAIMSAAPDLQRLATHPNGVVDQARLHALQAEDPSTLKLLTLAQRWMPTLILGMALAEAVAVFGLVLTILSHDAMQIVPFAAAAAVLMASHFPRLPALIERAKEVMHRP